MSQTLKFDNRIITILRNYAQINPSIYFQPGSVISTVSLSKSVVSYANVSVNFESSFAIYDLSKFLSILSIFKNPDLTIYDRYMKITEDDRSVTYTFCDPSNIRVAPPIGSKIDLGVPLVQFDLTDENMTGILKAAAILRANEIAIIGDGEKVSIEGVNIRKPMENVYSVIVGETDLTFKVVFNITNIKLLSGDYHVTLHKNPNRGNIFAKFTNDNIEYYNAADEISVL